MGVVRAETEEAVLKQVAAQVQSVHNFSTVSEEVVAQVRRVMRNTGAQGIT